MTKSSASLLILLAITLLSCNPKTEKKQVTIPPKILKEPKTGQISDNSFLIQTKTIPSNPWMMSFADAEETINAAISLVLKKIHRPNAGLEAWPGKIATDPGGFLHIDSRSKNQFYTTVIGDAGEKLTISMEIVSITFAGSFADSTMAKDPVTVIAVNEKNGEKQFIKLSDNLKQQGNSYSQTVRFGVKVSGKLENGTKADQIVYLNGVISLTAEELKRMKCSF